MNPIYLFEAGGTKTTLLIHRDGKTEEIALPGFNPNRYSEDFEKSLIQKITIDRGSEVFFYGAGLLEEANKQVVRDLFERLYKIVPTVYDDMTGAARAGFGNEPGLVAIMGTGGGAAFYDGQKIVKRNGGYGYLIDDYGGGLELGKIILSAWLNGDLPAAMDQALEQFVKCPKNDFVRQFYLSKDLSVLAGVVRVVAEFTGNPVVRELLESYFREFILRHVYPISSKFNVSNLFITGSIGLHFSEIIRVAAEDYNLEILGFDDQPGRALLSFHQASRTI